MASSDVKTLQTAHGPMMALAGDRYITGSLELYGEFSHGEWELFAQIVKPGAPVVYGSFTSNVDMKSGSPAFGTPEYVKAAFGAVTLAPPPTGL